MAGFCDFNITMIACISFCCCKDTAFSDNYNKRLLLLFI